VRGLALAGIEMLGCGVYRLLGPTSTHPDYLFDGYNGFSAKSHDADAFEQRLALPL